MIAAEIGVEHLVMGEAGPPHQGAVAEDPDRGGGRRRAQTLKLKATEIRVRSPR